MASPTTRRAPRYRTRILAIGALATGALYVIGAPIFANRIEDDLEGRVPAELAAAGFTGISATFSGQDGTLTCERPLDDPEAALQAAYDVWGVRAIDLDRSCRVNVATPPAEVGTDDTAAATPATRAPTTTTPTTSEPDFESVADIIAGSPQLALLAVLAREAGLDDTIGKGSETVTFFAPTDLAFDALPADALASLRSDPALLRRVLLHHETAGRWLVADLVPGPIETLAGATMPVTVDDGVDGRAVRVGGASIVTADILASNGVVHVVDRVLVPDDVDLSPPRPAATVTVGYDGTTVVFEGVVSTEVARAGLVAAAFGAAAIDDRLTVDPDVGLDAATAAELARLVGAVRTSLLEGRATFDGNGLAVSGVYASEAERDAVLTIAEDVDAITDLQPPPEADEDDALDLEAELNEFVAANPILFQPSSAVLSDSAAEILDQLARLAQQFGGVQITVEGHTDSDGDARENLTLSQRRANAVRVALVARGLDPANVTAEGFGSGQPVLVGGVEDKDASRRVEFRVVVAS